MLWILLQYIPRNMHMVFALLCFVVVIHWLIFLYPSGLLHWHWGNLTIATVPAKKPWWIWINTSCKFIVNDCITTTKQSTTKPCAYFLGCTVFPSTRQRKINQQFVNAIWPKIKTISSIHTIWCPDSRGCRYTEVSNITSQSYSQNLCLGVKANSPSWRLMWISTTSYWQPKFYSIHTLTINSA